MLNLSLKYRNRKDNWVYEIGKQTSDVTEHEFGCGNGKLHGNG